MQKLTLVILLALLALSLVAMADNGPNYVGTTDLLGAHNNGGRGCAGCHAPHSGGRGGGGNGGPATGIEGQVALWGQDLSGLVGTTFGSGDGGSFTFSISGQMAGNPDSQVTSIGTCLSCHDGNLAKGPMMTGVSYEQAWGQLSFAQTAGLGPLGNGSVMVGGMVGAIYTNTGTFVQNVVVPSSVTLYGSQPIPTLLGVQGLGPGDYSNQHPIGPKANAHAVSLMTVNGLSLTLSASNSLTIAVTPGSQYGYFVSNYGDPVLSSLATDVNSIPYGAGGSYVVCTTCHSQHRQNVYKGTMGVNGTPTAGVFKKYFFINGPYDPGAAWDPTHAPSTTQFCRQCHFSFSNEYYGINTVYTAY